MKIHNIKCTDCNDTIFSFFQHDYQKCKCGNSFLDGGFSYIRTNKDVQFDEIKDVIEIVRNKFTWGVNYDENNNRLKLTKKETKEWCKSKEGQEFKHMFLDDWANYWEGKKLMNKPTQYVLLKNLTSSHICGILSYFNNRAFTSIEKFDDIEEIINCSGIDRQWLKIHEIFTQELLYRIN